MTCWAPKLLGSLMLQLCQNESSKDMQTAVCCTASQHNPYSAGFRYAARGLQLGSLCDSEVTVRAIHKAMLSSPDVQRSSEQLCHSARTSILLSKEKGMLLHRLCCWFPRLTACGCGERCWCRRWGLAWGGCRCVGRALRLQQATRGRRESSRRRCWGLAWGGCWCVCRALGLQQTCRQHDPVKHAAQLPPCNRL